QIANLEPNAQRDLGILKNGMRSHRESIAFATTAVFIATGPMERPRLQRIDFFSGSATRATHAIGPALLDDVFFARIAIRTGPVELLEGHHVRNISLDCDDCPYQQNPHWGRG